LGGATERHCGALVGVAVWVERGGVRSPNKAATARTRRPSV